MRVSAAVFIQSYQWTGEIVTILSTELGTYRLCGILPKVWQRSPYETRKRSKHSTSGTNSCKEGFFHRTGAARPSMMVANDGAGVKSREGQKKACNNGRGWDGMRSGDDTGREHWGSSNICRGRMRGLTKGRAWGGVHRGDLGAHEWGR